MRFLRRRRSATPSESVIGGEACALCGEVVPVGADGLCDLGHRVRPPKDDSDGDGFDDPVPAGSAAVAAGAAADGTDSGLGAPDDLLDEPKSGPGDPDAQSDTDADADTGADTDADADLDMDFDLDW